MYLPIDMTRSTCRRRGLPADELLVDNFAGAGGASLGIEAALGRAVDIAINHDQLAIDLHAINHPNTQHLVSNIWEVDPVKACGGQPVGLAWFSPDCTHFSRAKGGKPRSQGIRGLAWIVLRWASAVRPRVIVLENVSEFQTWGPLDRNGQPIRNKFGKTFAQWVRHLRDGLGYDVDYREMVAADYGVPTTRKRFFLIARCDGRPIVWPQRTHAPRSEAASLGLHPWRAASECIDWSLPCPSIFERKHQLAENTLKRIAEGVRRFVIEAKNPSIIKCDHNDCAAHTLIQMGYGEKPGQRPRVPGVLKPLGTVVSGGNKFGLVSAFLTKLYGTCRHGQSVRDPMPTITGGGQHIAHVQAFLTKYYGSGGQQQDIRDPLHTITHKARFGLVTVTGEDYQIIDIGLRMLQPRELLRAQFGRFAKDYVLIGTKAQQIAGIGNSVPPELAEAIVLANVQARRSAASA